MINIFYEPGYAKRRKRIFTIKFNKSVLFNKLINFVYIFNLPIPDRFITNGPHKLMNNVIKAFRKTKLSVFNELKFDNSYIVQFDNFGENILKEIISKNNKKSKVIIGPLYTNEQLKKLSGYLDKYDFIKVLTPSENAANTIVNELNLNIDRKKICTIPIGVIKEKGVIKVNKITKRNNKCLVYFKNRDASELKKVLEILTSKNIRVDLFEYGKYDNNKLKKAAKKDSFGILLSSIESQGFAVQELMSCNLPLLVWDESNNKFEGRNISGSSVPHWSKECGLIVKSFSSLEEQLTNFILNIKEYTPSKLVLNELTYEKFRSNLTKEFNNF